MPRSTNPHNYETFYWELLQGMKAGVPEITLSLPANQATRTRLNFWAFINALESQAKREAKNGSVGRSSTLIHEANIMRGYLATIFVDNTELRHPTKNDSRPAELKFINRDMNPATESIREQLAEQLANLPVITEEEELPTPNVDSFFDLPLETPTDD